MGIDRKRFLLLTAALSACHAESIRETHEASSDGAAGETASPGADVVAARPAVAPAALATSQPAPSDPTSSASPASPASPDEEEQPGKTRELPLRSTTCAEIQKHNDALIAEPSGFCAGYEGSAERVRAEATAARSTPFFHYCHEGKGQWAVVLRTVGLSAPGGEAGGCGWGAAYRLLFRPGTDANLHQSSQSMLMEFASYPDDQSEVTREIAFDFDGDGRDEFILATNDWENGSGQQPDLRMFRSTGAAVVPYDIGYRVEGVADADGDGRPDLLSSGDFHDSVGCGLGSHENHGVPLLIHSLAGGKFSMSDETARRWAVSQCPKPESGANCEEKVMCMRLWGKTTSDIEAWVSKVPECSSDTLCIDRNSIMSEFAKASIPFQTLNEATPKPLARPKILVDLPANRGPT
jgi:hypothetical protein